MEMLLLIAGAGWSLLLIFGFVLGLWFPALETVILGPLWVVTLTSLGLAGIIRLKQGNLQWCPKVKPERGFTIGAVFFLLGLVLGSYL